MDADETCEAEARRSEITLLLQKLDRDWSARELPESLLGTWRKLEVEAAEIDVRLCEEAVR